MKIPLFSLLRPVSFLIRLSQKKGERKVLVSLKKSSPNNKGLSVFLEDFDFVFSLSLLSVVFLSSLTRARHTARFVFFYFFARARFFSREDDLTHLMT